MKVTIYITLLSQVITLSTQSITGITYADNFDFEDRYRDIHECDPAYWHPLHLPERCSDVFEKLIRNKIPGSYPYPVRVVKDKFEDYKITLPIMPDTPQESSFKIKADYGNFYDVLQAGNGQVQMMSLDTLMSPSHGIYDSLVNQLTKEAEHTPVAATFAVIPQLGPVALYRQPVSRNSEKIIEKWTRRHTYPGTMNDNSGKVMYYQEIPKGMKTSHPDVESIKKKIEAGNFKFLNDMPKGL